MQTIVAMGRGGDGTRVSNIPAYTITLEPGEIIYFLKLRSWKFTLLFHRSLVQEDNPQHNIRP